jgi:hypothetical protein
MIYEVEERMKKLIFSDLLVVLSIAFIGLIFDAKFIISFNPLVLIIVLIIGTIYSFFIIGFNDSIKSFKIPFNQSATDEGLKISLKFFNTLEKAYLSFGLLGAIINVIDMFKSLEDPSQIGVRFASTTYYICFSLLLILLFVIPYKSIINSRYTSP